MNLSKIIPGLGSAAAVILAVGTAASARADYQTLVLQDNPVLYYRLSEGVTPAQYPAAMNLGSLGAAVNGAYNHGPSGIEMKQAPGALTGSTDASVQCYNPIGDIGVLPTSYVDVPYNAALNPNGPFTVEFWAKPSAVTPTDATGLSPLFGTDPNAGRSGWLFYMTASRAWNFRIGNASGYITQITGGSAAANVWQHVAAVYDGTSVTLYVNGQVAAGPNAAPATRPTARPQSGSEPPPSRTDSLTGTWMKSPSTAPR